MVSKPQNQNELPESISYEGSTLIFHRYGNGEKKILLFHGFGQDHRAFQSWIAVLKNDYTLFVFDLFFHGDSMWGNHEVLEKNDWKKIIGTLLTQEKINAFEIVGFSMGGKFALATLEAFPHQVKKITLLAPDGIKTNFWYSLATYPIAFRHLFKSMINRPQRFKALENFALKVRLIDKSLLRFVESQMNTPEKRERVYYAWVVFRHLKFNMKTIANIINSNKINITLFVGKYDKIITVKNMDLLLNKLDDYKLGILETGHKGVIQESAKVLGKFSG